ncbi:MAG TPA: hypothetical protein VM120_05490 [Bryobacteraceae bacterium]|nr:hypothetical protein [Bryobacteraceae bacterium]
MKIITGSLLPLAAVLAAISLQAGGGFWIEFGNPTASKDPKAKDAAVVVRALGRHHPEQATYTGTAEGVVDGRRQSIRLKFVALTQPGLFAVARSWPVEGRWVLHIRSSKDGMAAEALARVARDGTVERPAKQQHGAIDSRMVEKALE